MAIEVKTNTGEVREASSKGMGVAGVTLGAIGTGLGLINGGFLGGGLLGNRVVENVATTAAVVGTEACCFVGKDQFYTTLIQQINEQNANNLAVSNRMANIEAAVSQNAAVAQCNKDSIRREIEVSRDTFDMVISNERVVNDLILKNALCNTIKGTPMISPTQIGDNYLSPHRILSSYEPREFLPGRFHGGCRDGWDGCGPCDGYRGF